MTATLHSNIPESFKYHSFFGKQSSVEELLIEEVYTHGTCLIATLLSERAPVAKARVVGREGAAQIAGRRIPARGEMPCRHTNDVGGYNKVHCSRLCIIIAEESLLPNLEIMMQKPFLM